MDIEHNNIKLIGVHSPISFEYADRNSRENAVGLIADDLYKLARQKDDDSTYMLIGVSPYPVWKAQNTKGDTGEDGNVTDLTPYIVALGGI